MTSSVPSQLLAAIKGRKFTSVARLFASQTEFEAWTNVGHWTAQDGQTAAKIIEAWYAPGAGSLRRRGRGLHRRRGHGCRRSDVGFFLEEERTVRQHQPAVPGSAFKYR